MQNTQDINSIAIVGGGLMGTSIFNYLSHFNIPIVWHKRSDTAKALKKYQRKLQRALKNNLISNSDYNFRHDNHIITSEISDIYTCNLVIESISEDLTLKRDLITDLDKKLQKGAIIATNSSSFLPSQLLNNLDRIIGLHFFFPVETKHFVELITYKNNETINNFLSKIQLKVLPENYDNAFLLNRMMLKIQTAIFNLSQEHKLAFEALDSLIEDKLLTHGIFNTMDRIGLDTLYTSVCNYDVLDKDDTIRPLKEYLKQKVNKGDLGFKSQNGFFDYKQKTELDNKIDADIYLPILSNIIEQAKTWAKSKINNKEINIDFFIEEYL